MPTHHKGSLKEARALDCYIKLIRAADSAMAKVCRRLTDVQLTGTQFGTLEALYHLGPLSTGQIAAKLLKSGGNLTMVLDNLEKRGLIMRERSTEDRRSIKIHLTEQGRQLTRRIFPRMGEFIAKQMEHLSPDEQAQLGALCRKLGRAINETKAIS